MLNSHTSSRRRLQQVVFFVFILAVLALPCRSSGGRFGRWKCIRRRPTNGGFKYERVATGKFNNPFFAPYVSPDDDVIDPACMFTGRRRYMHNVECQYDFRAPEGNYIYLEFASFELDLDCNQDYVKIEATGTVRPGAVREHRHACGRLPKRSGQVIASDAVRLTFRSDGNYSCRGFAGFFHSFKPIVFRHGPGTKLSGAGPPGRCLESGVGRNNVGSLSKGFKRVTKRSLAGPTGSAGAPGNTDLAEMLSLVALRQRYCSTRAKRGVRGSSGRISNLKRNTDPRFGSLGRNTKQPVGRVVPPEEEEDPCSPDVQLTTVTDDLTRFSIAHAELQKGREILSHLEEEDSCSLQNRLCKETRQCVRFSNCHKPTGSTSTPTPQLSLPTIAPSRTGQNKDRPFAQVKPRTVDPKVLNRLIDPCYFYRKICEVSGQCDLLRSKCRTPPLTIQTPPWQLSIPVYRPTPRPTETAFSRTETNQDRPFAQVEPRTVDSKILKTSVDPCYFYRKICEIRGQCDRFRSRCRTPPSTIQTPPWQLRILTYRPTPRPALIRHPLFHFGDRRFKRGARGLSPVGSPSRNDGPIVPLGLGREGPTGPPVNDKGLRLAISVHQHLPPSCRCRNC